MFYLLDDKSYILVNATVVIQFLTSSILLKKNDDEMSEMIKMKNELKFGVDGNMIGSFGI